MIEKVKGRPYLHKLRVIHLLEADYDLLLKLIISRRTRWHSERHRNLDDSQWGSMPGRNCAELALIKEIFYDNARRLRMNVATMDLDAKACYDRMLVPLISLASRHHGTSDSFVKLHADTLQHMQYHIKTATGVTSAS